MHKFSKNFFSSHVREDVKRFILQKFPVINKEDFQDCSMTDLENFLKDDELHMSEEMLFEAIERWMKNEKSREEAYPHWVKHVRLTLVQPERFERRVLCSPVLGLQTAAPVEAS